MVTINQIIFCSQVEDIDGSVKNGAVLCFRDDWTHLGEHSGYKIILYFPLLIQLASGFQSIEFTHLRELPNDS